MAENIRPPTRLRERGPDFKPLSGREQRGSSSGEIRAKTKDPERVGAEEGTRTPTPLRVHGPEPCASANSATSAMKGAGRLSSAATGNDLSILAGLVVLSNPRNHEACLHISERAAARVPPHHRRADRTRPNSFPSSRCEPRLAPGPSTPCTLCGRSSSH